MRMSQFQQRTTRRVLTRNEDFSPRPTGHEAGQVWSLRVDWTLAFIPDMNYRGELSQEKVFKYLAERISIFQPSWTNWID